METFLQLAVNGLGRGAVFALLALGFVIIYKSTEVINFAHGSLVLFGGYLVVITQGSLGWVGSSLVGIVGAGLLGLVVERLLLSRSKLADPNSLALLTIGVDVIISEEIVRRLGVGIPFLGQAWDAKPIQVGGITLFRTHLVALGVAAVLITAFYLAFKYSGWGVAMRAQAENREAAALMGIRSRQVTATAWLVAGLLAGVAVLFLATQDFSGSGLSRGTHSIALAAFPAAILGGLDSTAGAVVGGLVVGLVEALSAQYISFDFSKSAVFLAMLVVLVVRPSGLFGTRESTRV
ncbi:branched-chain amino acid ABC transporter permease [Amycolatopsis alkalitolerans]|uniref:Branched-chain amino acid ABC transporter permease n=1 Tax=Amycolatopsis alkalitolerans TaxID=2547244 RepID=A0A5C4M601_9PSEU|nr:branched-chain amino acid ABC transporter permease [Amycolatopsis alkalitolerans]TNC27777.1 branched-chain amino acid ABC transporter permease [Amycolatopsis alkalitolerans]